MMRMWSVTAILVLPLVTCGAATQGPSDEVAQLRKEVEALRASVSALQKEVASLKARPPATGRPDFAARLTLAASLNSTLEAQEAIAKVAVDAAGWGEAKVVNAALAQIASTRVQQECQYRAAIRLGLAGKEAEAITLAKGLNSSSQSQRALSKIARGEAEDQP